MKGRLLIVLALMLMLTSLVSAVAPTINDVSIMPDEVGTPTLLYGYCNFTDTESTSLYPTFNWKVNDITVKEETEYVSDANQITSTRWSTTGQSIAVGEEYILVGTNSAAENSYFVNKTDLSFVQNATQNLEVSWMVDVDDNYFYLTELDNDQIMLFDVDTLENTYNISSPSAHYGVRVYDDRIYASGGQVKVYNATDRSSIINLTDTYISAWVPYVYNYENESLLYLAGQTITYVYDINDNYTLLGNASSASRHFGAIRFPGEDWFGVYGDNFGTGEPTTQINIFNATDYTFIKNVTSRTTKNWEAWLEGDYIFFSEGSFMDKDMNLYNLTNINGESIKVDEDYLYTSNQGYIYRTDKYIELANGNNLVDSLSSSYFSDEDEVEFTCTVTDEEFLSTSLSENHTVDVYLPEITDAFLYTESGNNFSVEDISTDITSIHTDKIWNEWRVNNESTLLGYWPCDFNETYPLDRSQSGTLDFTSQFTTAPTWIEDGSGTFGGAYMAAPSGNSGLICADCINLSESDDWTFEFDWKEPSYADTSTYGIHFAIMKSYVYDVDIRVQASDFFVMRAREGTSYITTAGSPTGYTRGDDNWHHVSASIDTQGSNIEYTMYIDGDLVDTDLNVGASLNFTPGLSNINFGLTYQNLSLDNLRIYKSVISDEERTRNYLDSNVHYADEHTTGDNVSVILTPISTGFIGDSVEVSMNDLEDFAYTLSREYPKDTMIVQRESDDYADVLINGTTTGSPTQVDVVARNILTNETTNQSFTVTGNVFDDTMSLYKGEYEIKFYVEGVEFLDERVDQFGVGDVYFIGGQSNAAQTASNDPLIDNSTNYTLMNCYGINDFTAYNYTLTELRTIDRYGKLGFEASQQENVPVLVFNTAIGGISINSYRTTGLDRAYDRYVYLTGGDTNVKAAYFYQGESNVASATIDYYYSELQLLLTSLFGNFTILDGNELTVSQVTKNSPDTQSPDNVRIAQQNSWYNLATSLRGSLNYDIYLGVDQVHPSGDSKIIADRRQNIAFLHNIFGMYEAPAIVTDIYKIDSTTIDVVYDKAVEISDWEGNTSSIAKGYLIRNSTGDIVLDDTNVVSTTLQDDDMTLRVVFDTSINGLTNISICTNFTCYGDAVVRTPTYELAAEILFDTPLPTSVDEEYVCEEIDGMYWWNDECNVLSEGPAQSSSRNVKAIVFSAFGIIALFVLVGAAVIITKSFSEGEADAFSLTLLAIAAIGLSIVLLVGYYIIAVVANFI